MERVLVESAIRAVLLAIAAAAVLRVLRITTASGRHATWTVVLLAMLTLPIWTLWGPKAALPVLPTRAVSVVVPSAPVEHVPFVAPAGDAPAMAPGDSPSWLPPFGGRVTPHATNISWPAIALAIYGLGLAILLSRLIVGTVRAQRIVRRAERHSGQLTSRQCSAPVTVGWLHPVVMLPDGWDQWSPAQLDAVLLHEREHARRRDPLIQWFALLNRAVFWFHPLAWWLERRLAALAEDACDAAVLAGGHQPAEYCEYLLSMARTVTGAGARVEIVGAAMPGAFLPQRIRRILKASPESQITRRRLAWALLTCAGVSVALTAATLVPAQSRGGTAPPPQSAGGRMLPEDWFDDDEWHLETAPLMSVGEMANYRALRTVAARDSFIAEFWERHDPTRGTLANEFRQEFERRIRYAKEHYADRESAATFGYQTDRGRWYMTSGPPDAVRVFGSRNVDKYGVSRHTEEWDYHALLDLGSNVRVRFDVGSYFGCTYRGGKYRILSPAPVSRFEGVTTAGSDRRPFAQTYPGRFVYLSFPIDEQAIAMEWGMRTDTAGRLILNDETGPIDYIQGQFLEPSADPARPGRLPAPKTLLAHFEGLQLFEPDAIACTEQLPAATYTLRINTLLVNGAKRTDSVTFTVE
jgi:GWxTD domain-containing protein